MILGSVVLGQRLSKYGIHLLVLALITKYVCIENVFNLVSH